MRVLLINWNTHTSLYLHHCLNLPHHAAPKAVPPKTIGTVMNTDNGVIDNQTRSGMVYVMVSIMTILVKSEKRDDKKIGLGNEGYSFGIRTDASEDVSDERSMGSLTSVYSNRRVIAVLILSKLLDMSKIGDYCRAHDNAWNHRSKDMSKYEH